MTYDEFCTMFERQMYDKVQYLHVDTWLVLAVRRCRIMIDIEGLLS
jgi:hypothetical protein